jgi:Zn-dependent M16 (insulinase) family peptidase
LFYSDAQEKMFPGTAYAHSSGGDPRFITDLTHEQLVKFHKDHYHPSNARFFTYGKIIKNTKHIILMKLTCFYIYILR